MREKIERIFVVLNYLVLILLILGQSTVGVNYMIGQCTYLAANIISVTRCWVLKRPVADKVKDCAMLGITCGLIAIKIFGGIRS